MSKLDSDFILNGEAFFALACYFKEVWHGWSSYSKRI